MAAAPIGQTCWTQCDALIEQQTGQLGNVEHQQASLISSVGGHTCDNKHWCVTGIFKEIVEDRANGQSDTNTALKRWKNSRPSILDISLRGVSRSWLSTVILNSSVK